MSSENNSSRNALNGLDSIAKATQVSDTQLNWAGGEHVVSTQAQSENVKVPEDVSGVA